MNLACPKCGAQDTRKISLLMSESGATNEAVKLGKAYVYNIAIPLATLVFAFLLGLLFGLFNIVVGLLVFAATLFAGWKIRGIVKRGMRSKFAELSAEMKRDGFRCSRCEHLFIPDRGASVLQ